MKARIERALGAARVPGAVVARVTSAGVDAIAAFGDADVARRRPVADDTAFHLYSGTKLFTAAAVMHLVERGALSLDGDAREHIPGLPRSITARQLLSHTSGLPRTLRGFLAVHFPDEPRPTTAEALARYKLAGGGPPGEVAYRNVNYAVLGELIARVSGRAYEELVIDALLEPWGSKAVFASADAGDLATGYVLRFDPMRWIGRLVGVRPEVFAARTGGHVALRPFDLDTAAIGGLIGAAADFAPLVVEFLGDRDGVLAAETRRTMLEPVARGAAGVASTVGVGLGWKIGDAGGVRFCNHEGGGPGFCTELRIYPELDLGFVVLANLSQTRRLSLVIHELCESLRQV